MIETVAVCGGAGDAFLADAAAAGADAYLTADLRHHPASEHLAGGGPALLDAAHWATERPWLDDARRPSCAARLAVDTSCPISTPTRGRVHAAVADVPDEGAAP